MGVLTPEQASLGILSCVIGADGSFSTEEQELLLFLANRHPHYRDMTAAEFEEAVNLSVESINEIGWKKWALVCSDSLPVKYVPTVFALAADFSLIDGEPNSQEAQIIRELKDILGIPDKMFDNILAVMCFKNGIVE